MCLASTSADLKETDQKKVREWVDKNFETVEEGKGKSAGTEERERKPGGEGSEDEAGEPLEGKPVVEYAKSAKSVCRLCSQNIEMGEVRVGKLTTSEDIAFRGERKDFSLAHRITYCIVEVTWREIINLNCENV